MAVNKPSIPKGTRDFSSLEMLRRRFIFNTIKSVFEQYSFMPLETPTMENLSTLMGKYGDEGDKLLFKVLDSGDFLSKLTPESIEKGSPSASVKICTKGLRYDLTVPFARYVVQHKADLIFPFKRYQIQPVWRADRPQKGRYREFYQCDVDVIGSKSMLNELELVQIVSEVFRKLNINVLLKLNNRKILYGISESIGHADKMMDITVAIDKLDKIGLEAVEKELVERGIDAEAVAKLRPILELKGTNNEKLSQIESIINVSETGVKGIAEVRELLGYVDTLGVNIDLELDLSLARGLNYYTGAIFEVKAKDHSIGSICGGGRYDDLTGIFGLKDMSGVGISFGADRIYDVMNSLELFPESTLVATKVLFLNFGGASETMALKSISEIRAKGISSEVYPDAVKIKKQMDYANKRNIPFVIIIGDNELSEGVAIVKNMNSGEQSKVSLDSIYKHIG